MTWDQLVDDVLATRPRPVDARPGDAAVQAEEKLDGHRLTVVSGPARTLAFGRDLEIDVWPELGDVLRLGLPPLTVLDGELHEPGRPATDVRRRRSSLIFSPFAAPVLRGEDFRGAPLSDVGAVLRECGFSQPGLRPVGGVLDAEEIELLREEARLTGVEGYVLKQQHWAGWTRIKVVSTADCEVIGWIPGTGKHAGRMGALLLAAGRTVVGKVGTGFTDRDRERPPSDWVGRVVEVAFQSVAAAGRLQHPRFLRLRPDKSPSDCSVDRLVDHRGRGPPRGS